MPLFLDIHKGEEGMTAEAIEEAHRKDLAIQEKYGVKYLRYWYDLSSGRAFCLWYFLMKRLPPISHREAPVLLAT